MSTNGPQVYQPNQKSGALAPTNGAAPLAHAGTGETAGMVLAAQAKALVEARFTIALRNPRDVDAVRARMLRECQRPSFAEVAIYHKPVGEGIEGPSIRFAEAAIQAMGNLSIETPTIYDDAEKRIVRVTVADMETNVTHSKDVTIQKTVERSSIKDGDLVLRQRTNSRGRPVYVRLASDDEILNTENALVSKALRTTGLRLVPGWLIDECMVAVRSTRAQTNAADPDAARRKLFDAFGSVGVPVEQIKAWLGHDGTTLQPKELDELRGIYTAIREGDTTWREVMDQREVALEDAKKASGKTDGQKPDAATTPTPTPAKGNAGVKAAIRSQSPVEAIRGGARGAVIEMPAEKNEDPAPLSDAGERKAPDTSSSRQVRAAPARSGDEFNFDR
jgi:hypothetical protein